MKQKQTKEKQKEKASSIINVEEATNSFHIQFGDIILSSTTENCNQLSGLLLLLLKEKNIKEYLKVFEKKQGEVANIYGITPKPEVLKYLFRQSRKHWLYKFYYWVKEKLK